MWIELDDRRPIGQVEAELRRLGVWTQRLAGARGEGLSVEAHSASVAPKTLRALPGVHDVYLTRSAHPLLDRQAGQRLELGGVLLGASEPLLLAGPCSVESERQIREAAQRVADAGGHMLRGGAYKPRSSPYAFAGHGRPALGWLRDAADAHGLQVVTEVLSETDVEAVAAVADLLQIGSRNMQNYALLHAVGEVGKPVLLKRGAGARVDEWLLAAEHLLAAGSGPVVFCERGIRGFDPSTRNLLDLGAVALLAKVMRQPVIVDPSHAAGRRDLIHPLALAALAAGAAGLLVEMHPDPGCAQSDAAQALAPPEWEALARAVGSGNMVYGGGKRG